MGAGATPSLVGRVLRQYPCARLICSGFTRQPSLDPGLGSDSGYARPDMRSKSLRCARARRRIEGSATQRVWQRAHAQRSGLCSVRNTLEHVLPRVSSLWKVFRGPHCCFQGRAFWLLVARRRIPRAVSQDGGTPHRASSPAAIASHSASLVSNPEGLVGS